MSYQEKKARRRARVGGLRALALFVFLILAAQYESWSLPSACSWHADCHIWRLCRYFCRRMELNLYAQIGLVMLIAWLLRTPS